MLFEDDFCGLSFLCVCSYVDADLCVVTGSVNFSNFAGSSLPIIALSGQIAPGSEGQLRLKHHLYAAKFFPHSHLIASRLL